MLQVHASDCNNRADGGSGVVVEANKRSDETVDAEELVIKNCVTR